MSMLELRKNKQLIIKKYEEGIKTTDIAKEFHCSGALVYLFLRDECKVLIKNKKFQNYVPITGLEEAIKLMFQSGKSIYRISKDLKINKCDLRKWLIKNGFNTNIKSTSRIDKLTNHTKEILEKYNKGESTCSIAKEYNSTSTSIMVILNKNGIECRDRATFTLDETYFEKIDTIDKAYWLGWMYSDGSVGKDGKIRLSLQERDSEIVKQFKEDIQYTGPLHFKPTPVKQPNKQPQLELCINRQKVAKDLIALGCEPNKTFTLKFPTQEQVPDELLGDFLRGFFDGDGSILPKKTVMIVATKEFFEGMVVRLPFKIDFTYYCRHPERQNNITQFCINRRESVLKFLRFLYDNDKFCLQRKKDKYLTIPELKAKKGV